MSLELREFARRLEKTGYKAGANLLRASANSWAKEGLIPNKLPSEEINEKATDRLGVEWNKQVKRYLKLGFHKELGFSEEDYLSSLPRFESQPEAFKGRFDLPVLVETRISVAKQAELGGLTYYLKNVKVRDWEEDPKGYKTPKAPYTTWMQDGRNYRNWTVRNFRQRMDKDERGATEFDGVALYIKNPKILKNHSIDLPGTSVGSVGAAFLDLWGDEPGLRAGHVGSADSGFGSASCGR